MYKIQWLDDFIYAREFWDDCLGIAYFDSKEDAEKFLKTSVPEVNAQKLGRKYIIKEI